MDQLKPKLLVTYFFPPHIGGIESYYLELLAQLNSAEISVLAQHQTGDKEFDETLNYPVYRTEFFAGQLPPRWLSLRSELKKIIKKRRVETLIFGHFHPFNAIGHWLNTPYYLFGHGTDIRRIKNSWWQKLFFKYTYKYCRGLILNSQYLATAVSALIADQTKIHVVYPGVNYDSLNQTFDSRIESERLGIGADDLIILSMGRLVHDKGYANVIKSLPTLIQTFPKIKYIIAGTGPEESNLKNLVADLKLDNHVVFTGAVANNDQSKASYYQLANIYVGVSLAPEGLGVSYLEAQACAIPVIASRHGGSSEAVVDGQTGLLIEPGNQTALIDALAKLLGDEDLCQRLGNTGRQRVKAEFNWPTQAAKIMKIIDGAI